MIFELNKHPRLYIYKKIIRVIKVLAQIFPKTEFKKLSFPKFLHFHLELYILFEDYILFFSKLDLTYYYAG